MGSIVIGALSTAMAGVLSLSSAALAAETGTDIGAFGPALSGGGAAAAVGGLVWVAKKVINGELVPRDVADAARQMRECLERAESRENSLMSQVSVLSTRLDSNTAALAEMKASIARIERRRRGGAE